MSSVSRVAAHFLRALIDRELQSCSRRFPLRFVRVELRNQVMHRTWLTEVLMWLGMARTVARQSAVGLCFKISFSRIYLQRRTCCPLDEVQ